MNLLHVLNVDGVQHHDEITKQTPNKHRRRNCKIATLGRLPNLQFDGMSV